MKLRLLTLALFCLAGVAAAGENELQTLIQEIRANLDRIEEIAVEAPPEPEPPTPDPDDDDDTETDPSVLTDPIELIVDGQQWSFNTPAPENIQVRSGHPRLLLRRELFDDLKAKLSSDLYAKDLRIHADNPAYQALRYAVYGETAQGELAKAALLALPETLTFKQMDDGALRWSLVYDWIHPLLSKAEQTAAAKRLFAQLGMIFPEDGSATIAFIEDKNMRPTYADVEGGFPITNDAWEADNHSKGLILRAVVAMALSGDGVCDAWCDYVMHSTLHGGDLRFIPFYAPEGGMLDGHMLLALDSGGCQAGRYVEGAIMGYTSMFVNSPARVATLYESATDDPLMTRDNFFKLLPHYLAYTYSPPFEPYPGNGHHTDETLDLLSGVYKHSAPEMAAVSLYLNQMNRKAKSDIVSLVAGDRRVTPKSPGDLNWPLSKLLRGADEWHSRSSWDYDTATHVQVTAPALLTSRQESAAGILGIDRGPDPLVVDGRHKKGAQCGLFGSGPWVGNLERFVNRMQSRGPYWGADHLRVEWTPDNKGTGPLWATRSNKPRLMATHKGFRGASDVIANSGNGWSAITQEFGQLFTVDGIGAGVKKWRRTVVHLLPDSDGREFVIVVDDVDVPQNRRHCINFRTMQEPLIEGNRATITQGASQAVLTVIGQGATMIKRGGEGSRTIDIDGNSHDGEGYYFWDDTDDAGHAIPYGLWSLFVKPPPQETYQYRTVIEIGPKGFTPVDVSTLKDTVQLGGRQFNFESLGVQ